MIRRVLAIVLLGSALPSAPLTAQVACAQERPVTVFAAASLKNALDEINAAFAQPTGLKVVASYAASSALMKQIEQGAPADVFVSADLAWMDYGAQRQLIQQDTRFDLLGNQLVLIAPKDSMLPQVSIAPGLELAALAGGGRIVTGDVRAVPVGSYAKAALESVGLWRQTAPKLAMTENVRAALALVARGEAPLGIVYASDARIEPDVKVIGTFPPQSHPPIVYPVALTAAARREAVAYLAFLRSATAKGIFEKYGFAFLPRPRS